MLDYVKRITLALGILLVGVTATRAFTLSDGSSGALSRTIVNNLGEEYRMNSPVITYTYDESFLSYFGSNGVVAVNKAFDLLNAIPPASSIKTNYPPSSSTENNLWNYPIRPDRLHARAYNDRILDIKSYAMAELFSFMGLGNPEDSAFQLEFGVVALRNWDPISYGPSKYVNGSLLSWVVVGASNAVPFPIDVTKPVITLAGSSYHRNPRLAEGKYLVAPTRDDIGGYKYLYRKDNFNIEGLPPSTYQMVRRSASRVYANFSNASRGTFSPTGKYYKPPSSVIHDQGAVDGGQSGEIPLRRGLGWLRPGRFGGPGSRVRLRRRCSPHIVCRGGPAPLGPPGSSSSPGCPLPRRGRAQGPGRSPAFPWVGTCRSRRQQRPDPRNPPRRRSSWNRPSRTRPRRPGPWRREGKYRMRPRPSSAG